MNTRNVKFAAAIIGGSAVVAIGALYTGVSVGGSDITTANTSIVSFTAPSSTPSVTMAVPGITGPAPMYAGQAPNANPLGG